MRRWEPSPRCGRARSSLLEEQAQTRVPELVPIRYGRMLVSPFTFYRGAAYIMASDLAGMPRTGLHAQLCGDAHLSNFGAFAAPDRRLVFSINDFDETLPGPFEWDVKRLVASFAVAGRDRGFDDKQREAVNLAVGRAYREAMSGVRRDGQPGALVHARRRRGAVRRACSVAVTAKQRKRAEQNLAKTRSKDSLRAFAKLTEIVDGEPRIVGDPPVVDADRGDRRRASVCDELEDVPARRDPFLPADAGRRPPPAARALPLRRTRRARSSGSAASARARTSCCCSAATTSDPLFLQFKEAEASVLEPFLGKSEFANHGQRVVEGQRLTQAASDIMLGWIRVEGSTASSATSTSASSGTRRARPSSS